MIAALSRREPVREAAGLLALALLVWAAFAAGAPELLLLPLVLAAVAALRHLPLRFPTLLLVALVLGVDNPQEIPAAGHWSSPLRPLGTLIFENLNSSLGIGPLHLPLLDLLVVGLLLMGVVRGEKGAPGARPLSGLLVGALLALGLGEVWGALRGGDMRQSLYQLQQLAFGPLLALLFLRALRGPRDLAAVGAVVLGAAVVKTGFGVYFYEVICKPLNMKPAYATTHSDSVLFVVALAMALAYPVLRGGGAAWMGAALLAVVVAAGIYVNNRRLAFVELGAMAPILYALAPPSRAKRQIRQVTLALIPVLLVYGAAGWTSGSSIFKPVQLVRSVVSADADRSTGTRDIEDYNLIQTLKPDPLLGTGFGHEYDERVRADDISAWFPQYRYVPHNSTLGLLAFGGMAVFALVWLPMLAGALLAARSATFARDPLQRTAAVGALAALLAYAVQGFGDMGLQSWPATVLAALALAVSSQLAVACGAFPADVPLLGAVARVNR